MRLPHRLRLILTISFALVAALPLLGIGLLSLRIFTKSLSQEITLRNYQLAESLANEVQEHLNRYLDILDETRMVIEGENAGDRESIQGLLDGVIAMRPDFFRMILILDKDGVVTHAAPADPDFMGMDWSRHVSFEGRKEPGRVHWSPTFPSPKTGVPTMTLSIPLGEGFLVGYLNLANVRRFTSRGGLGRGSYAAIVDRHGKAVAHSQDSKVFEQINFRDVEAVRRGLAGQEGAYRFKLDGRDQLGSVAIVRQTGWPVVVVQSAEDAFAPVRKMQALLGIGILAAALLAAEAGILCLKRIQNPLHQLTVNAKKVALGDYDFARPKGGYREIDELSADFEAMIKAVRSRESDLRASQERFKAVFQQAAVGMSVQNLDGRFLRVNQRYLDLVGYSREDLLVMNSQDLTHPDDRASEMEFREMFKTGEISNYRREKRFRCKDGRMIWANVTLSLLRDESGRPMRVITVLEDISERKRAEEALFQSEYRYRSLVENAPYGFFLMEARSNRFIFVNRRMCGIFGYTAEELGRLGLYDITDSGEHALIRERIQMRRGGRRSPYSPNIYTGLRKDGESLRCEISGSMVTLNGESVLQGILQDVTQRENLQRQLQHAQKMEAVGTLAGGVAHEFNNILMAIQGYTQLLAGGRLGPSASHYLEKIGAATKRAAELTGSMLSFSHLESGDKGPVDLNEVMAEVRRLLSRTLPPEIRLEFEPGPDLPPVLANPNELQQIIMNLAINARDAMPAGGGCIRFSTRLRFLGDDFLSGRTWSGVGEYVELEAADDGSGIGPELLEHVFEPFFTTKDPGRGTGLGLSVVYSILENLGGGITVQSNPGQGSRFSVFLPALAGISAGKAARIPRAVPPPGGGQCVLVVDDEPAVREITREALEGNGYRVMEAGDGARALELYRSCRDGGRAPDLVILDLAMPVMNGRDCLKRLLELDPEVRVIIATGHGGSRENLGALGEQTAGLLLKPFDLNALLDETARCLQA